MSLAKHSVIVLISSLHGRFGSVNRLYVIAGGGRRAHGHGAAQLIGEFLKVVILNALSSQVFNGLISILDECLRASNWLLQSSSVAIWLLLKRSFGCWSMWLLLSHVFGRYDYS